MRTTNLKWSNLELLRCPKCSLKIEPAPLKKEIYLCEGNDCDFKIQEKSILRIVETLHDKTKLTENMKFQAFLRRLHPKYDVVVRERNLQTN